MNHTIHTFTMPLTQTCRFEPQLRKDDDDRETHESGNKKTNFHSFTFRPPGGISDKQIYLLMNRFRQDQRERLAIKGTLGIEGVSDSRHIHIALVLPKPKRDSYTTRPRYIEALQGYLPDGGSRNKVAVNFWQPGKAIREYLTQATFLAYPLKQLGRGTNGEAILPDFGESQATTGKYYSFGLFDGLNGQAFIDERRIFGKAIKRHWKKKLDNQRTVYIDGSKDFHTRVIPDFARKHLQDIHPTKQNRPKIIAAMYCYENEKIKYRFSKGFFRVIPYAFDHLNSLDDQADNIHAAVLQLVTERYDKIRIAVVGRKRNANRKEIADLRRQLEAKALEIKHLNEIIKCYQDQYGELPKRKREDVVQQSTKRKRENEPVVEFIHTEE